MSEHGSYGKYQLGCRCAHCVEANRNYARDYRKRRGLGRQVELTKIQRRALARLREAHYSEYHLYLAEERRSAGLQVQGYPR